jgi:hypothetical protein
MHIMFFIEKGVAIKMHFQRYRVTAVIKPTEKLLLDWAIECKVKHVSVTGVATSFFYQGRSQKIFVGGGEMGQ